MAWLGRWKNCVGTWEGTWRDTCAQAVNVRHPATRILSKPSRCTANQHIYRHSDHVRVEVYASFNRLALYER